ncbi:MAG: hypothetical protein GW948_08370, partial [Rhodobacterales bacterium]|nr:hypothetical protein [Rhodobacterales bacterium]
MTTIFFIVDGRGLEAQATLLAATLWQHNAAHYPLLAYLPERHVGAVSTPARALFDRCGVTLRPLPPAPRDWHRPYPHGNKLLAAADRRAGDWS